MGTDADQASLALIACFLRSPCYQPQPHTTTLVESRCVGVQVTSAHVHQHFAFEDDMPKPVLEFIVENGGEFPTEAEYNQLIAGEVVDAEEVIDAEDG